MSSHPHILVGSEGSGRSTDALVLGARLADALGGTLAVAAVLEHDLDAIDPDAELTALQRRFELTLEHAGQVLGATPFEAIQRIGAPPAHALAVLAREQDADVIVIGSTHRGRFGRVYPGSVGEHLIRETDRPVAVAPAGYAERAPEAITRIGVGFDGREPAGAAFELSRSLARLAHAKLDLIGGVNFEMPITEEIARPFDSRQVHRERLVGMLDHARGIASADGARVEASVCDGDPAEILVEWSEELDLLLVGTRARRRLTSAVLGSVSDRVIRTASCPVIVVPGGRVGLADFNRPGDLATSGRE